MTFNWRHSALILADCLLAVYLFMAVTAINRPDETADVCTAMNIHIEDGQVRGFLDTNDVKAMLLKDRLYPLGDPMSKVDVRRIEELIASNPFVKSVECYKTHSGTVHLNISQRLPVIRVKSDGGDDYYVDDQGNVMPQTRFVSNMVVATGHIQRPYAQKILTALGRYLSQHAFWNNQIEQVNILSDGSMEMVPRVGEHIVYLGQPRNLERKLERLEKFYRYGLSKAGWNKYSYINLEFDNQIICKKRKRE